MITVIMALVGIFSAAIDHGSSTVGKFGGTIMVVLGIFCALLSFASGTRVGGAFTHGKGETVPINPAGRVILFLLALVLVIVGLLGFFHWVVEELRPWWVETWPTS